MVSLQLRGIFQLRPVQSRSARGLLYQSLGELYMNIASLPRVIVLTLLTIIFAGLAMGAQSGGTESNEAAKAAVLRANTDYQQAIKTRDRAGLERSLALRLSWIARGVRLERAQVIDDFMSGNLHFKALRHDNERVEVFGNTAIISGHSTSTLEYKGQISDKQRLYTSVWLNMDGRWQMISNHVTDLCE
jgi:ketosteroid isomerase-like protein